MVHSNHDAAHFLIGALRRIGRLPGWLAITAEGRVGVLRGYGEAVSAGSGTSIKCVVPKSPGEFYGRHNRCRCPRRLDFFWFPDRGD